MKHRTVQPFGPANLRFLGACLGLLIGAFSHARQPETPAALVSGQPIPWDELRPMLAEAAGGQVLQEAALDRLLAAELKAKGLSITESDVIAEHANLTDAIVRDARANANDAERLVDSVRRTRGLGELRFRRLLERNAKMRKLVAPGVNVSDEEVGQAFEMLHGEKFRLRVIVTQGQSAVADLRESLSQGTENLSARFAQAAIAQSTDNSSIRGGLLEPISPVDPAYPATLRDAIRTLSPGQMTPVLAADRGFVVALVEERIPADGARLSEQSEAIRAEVRQRRERLAMDELARRLLAGGDLKVMDRSLDWSLKAQRAGPQP